MSQNPHPVALAPPPATSQNNNMREPLGYLLTWTTYGTWLPGDPRGWVEKGRAWYGMPYEAGKASRVAYSRDRMKESPVILDGHGRRAVEAGVEETCRYRNWQLHAVSARLNHVHAVVTAPGTSPNRIVSDLKAYGTRALNRLYLAEKRKNWWTGGGSKRHLYDERALCAAIEYVRNQDEHQGEEDR